MRRAMAVMALATLVSGCDYNRLVALREQIDAAWAQVENQRQRRNDLIPNLVEVTRAYAAHEREIFVHVADARARPMSAGSRDEEFAAAADPGERRVARPGAASAAGVPYPLTGCEVCQNARCRVPERDAGGTRKPAQHGATGWHGP